ncbi:hypothetical protein QAD02_002607 [Eretmocerus hayati]|uniref:Uncharacterized protein n=1 Tax=Eretmocerus hayati TaxID=131215 RepID=A0ACC2NJG1_9HYME|nr:hypothetical protein QAD02_002607 [Eretmocerus hayati]
MKYFKTAYDVILRSSDLKNWYETSVNSLIDQMVEFERVGRGWSLEKIVSLKAIITKADLLNGASFIRLPKYISHKKAVVNIECSADENDCFARLIDRPKFEGLNYQTSVNVFQISEEKQIYPVYLTFDEEIQHVNLLLLHDGEKSYYCYIRHLSRLISGQISSHGHVTFTCNTCFHCFPTRDKLQEHKSNCSEINDCPVILPNENEKTLKFKNHHQKEAIHSIVYADFECLLTQYNYEQVNDRFFELNNVYEDDKENIPPQESPNATFSDYGKYAKLKKSKIVGKAFQRHVPYSAGLYYHDRYEAGKSYYTSSRRRNCTTLFAQELKRIAEVVQREIQNFPTLHMSVEDEEMFQALNSCHICGEEFNDGDKKVRDHQHRADVVQGEDGTEEVKKTAKGVTKSVIRNKITFEDYFQCLFMGKTLSYQQKYIRNELHRVFTVNQSKIALRRHDDKRSCDTDNVHTLPWGYKGSEMINLKPQSEDHL